MRSLLPGLLPKLYVMIVTRKRLGDGVGMGACFFGSSDLSGRTLAETGVHGKPGVRSERAV